MQGTGASRAINSEETASMMIDRQTDTASAAGSRAAEVRVTGLTKRFGDRVAVDGVSFSIHPGEIFGLLGPNGAGKSTTVNVLSTYLSPDGGHVTIGGMPVGQGMAVKALIGVVPQELALYEDLTAEENLDFFARVYGLSRTERKSRVQEVLVQVGLEERSREAVRDFSGGMKRRLNLAVGIVHRPRFVMLDEPTVGVDPQSREKIFDIIRGLQRGGATLLYTSHYMEEVEQLCDRIAIMDDGRIIAAGTLEELLRLRVEEIEVERPRGLEQLFIQLTGRRLRD
jgi:ABC-2 type transport system ATP-binding protein